jgi:hypothetical protein
MNITDLAPGLDSTGLDSTEPGQDTAGPRTDVRYAGVAWGLAERRDGQDDLDGQDVAKPRT